MESKALTEYKIPNYPRKEEVQSQPSLLRKSVYKRWHKLLDFGVSGMLAASLSLSGCTEEAAKNPNQAKGSQTAAAQNPNSSKTKTVPSKKVAALVAPIFEHGEGRGSIGCVVVSPPAFLSEDEALVVIKEELIKNGIDLNKEKVVFNNAQVKPIGYGVFEMLGFGKKKPFPLEIDAQDSDKQINIEFISMSDCKQLGGTKEGWFNFQKYDTRKAAVQFRKQVRSNKEQGIYGIFYDPAPENLLNGVGIASIEITLEDRQSVNELTKKIARIQLKKQVEDFARWLKKQGVIK